MKQIAFYLICIIALLAATSCQREDEGQLGMQEAFTITINVDQLQTGVKTRANIISEPGENVLNNLYLVFFNYEASGNGEYVGYHKVVSNNLEMNGSYIVPVTITSGATISGSQMYSMLAFSNLEATASGNDGYVEDIATFLNDFNGRTENAALHQTFIEVTGVGNDETDDTHTISSNNLFMSARVIKPANNLNVPINLKRGVARFDVYSHDTSHYLVSASIWSAVQNTPLWENVPVELTRTQRFYGIKNIEDNHTKGKLYAFENIVVNPGSDDTETTCLIVGLEGLITGTVKYYRINIHHAGAAQQLRRNYSYKIDINTVLGEGENTEYEAWTKNKNELMVTVNNWNLDDNGIILTDGVNTLGLGSKLIRINPNGETLQHSLYTVGTGKLEISKSDMPLELDNVTPGFVASITGNVLKVVALPLPAGLEKRRGSVEISFAGLRGSITLLQEIKNDKQLTVDRNIITDFPPVGRNGMSFGPLTVTASGPWVAEIINTDELDANNPGFSFLQSGAPVVTLTSETNPLKNMFQIYTTGDNPYKNNKRNGVVIVSLVEDPDNYSIALPLTQTVLPAFEITPAVSQLRFGANGLPTGTQAVSGSMYVLSVTTGEEDWDITLEGADSDKFIITRPTSESFTIRANGQNLTNAGYTATIKITCMEDVIYIPVIQDIPVISGVTSGLIPAEGGKVTVTVNSSNFKWNAEILYNWDSGSPSVPHEAWMESMTDSTPIFSLTNQTANGQFRVGFGALDFPLVNMSPKVYIKLSIVGAPDVQQIVEVVQLPMIPPSIEVMNVRSTDYGNLGSGTNYFTGYNNFLRSTALFGLNGRVKLPPINITNVASGTNNDPGVIPSTYRYLHAGGDPRDYSSARFASVEQWRTRYDGIVVFVCDVDNGAAFTDNNSTVKILGYQPSGQYNNTPRINAALLTTGTVLQKNIMNYLLNDGPFGKVNNPANLTYTINTVSTNLSSYPAGAVPVITNANGHALLVIDPLNKMVFLGEAEFFNTGYNVTITSEKDKFLGNLLSYILNSAMNGSAFTKDFMDEATYNSKYAK